MASTVRAGLAVTAHNNATINFANFNNVSVTASTATTVQMAAYNFAGTDGTEASEAPSTTANNVSAGAVTRGSGLTASNQGSSVFGNSIASVPSSGAGNTYGSDLAGAIAKNQYYQFTLTAAAGHTLSFASLSFAAWAQNGESTFGAGLQYSTDGVHFTTVPLTGALGGASPGAPRIAQADLSGQGALQNVSGTVTFRIYLFGVGAYEDSGLGQTQSNSDLSVLGSVS
jgi:hypothetical protein